LASRKASVDLSLGTFGFDAFLGVPKSLPFIWRDLHKEPKTFK